MTTRSGPHDSPVEPAPVRTHATVLGSLTNGRFRLQLTDGRLVVAHAALDLRKVFTRLLPGDRVEIEISPFDHDLARICRLIESDGHRQPTR